jgi:hypothetical protein
MENSSNSYAAAMKNGLNKLFALAGSSLDLVYASVEQKLYPVQ